MAVDIRNSAGSRFHKANNIRVISEIVKLLNTTNISLSVAQKSRSCHNSHTRNCQVLMKVKHCIDDLVK